MKAYNKRDFPVSEVRRYLEPGPVVLISSACNNAANIMTLGWHMVMEFSPSRIGCFITAANYSYGLIRRSGECVINIPTTAIAAKVVDIGNTSGRDIDKFVQFDLTAEQGETVAAPLIRECYANFECRLADDSLLEKYSLFVLEVVRAQVATSPKYPRTMHYRGDGVFMIAGENTARYRRRFRPELL